MVKQLTKVIYKPDSMSTEEYTMFVNAPEYKKWKEGDTTIPLTDIVDSFDVFVSTQGKQGVLGRASNQQLETVFGSKNDLDVAEKLLKDGSMQSAESLHDDKVVRNPAQGGFQMDIRGSGARLTGA